MRMSWPLLLIVALLAWTVGCSQQSQPSGGSETGRELVADDVGQSGSQESLSSGGSGTTASETPTTSVAAKGTASVAEVVLCGKCGQIKGSESCCLENADVCADCGLAKGSPGCCKITKGADVTLCAKCGQIKGSEACCDPNAPRCEKCGLAKGSIGCCKIEI